MKIIFLSGPYRGEHAWKIRQNINRAEELAWQVWALGAACLCPHLNTANFQGSLEDKVWLEGDLAMLRKCDAVMLTRDWRRSAGASAEREEALRLGLPVFETLADLRAWVERDPVQQSLPHVEGAPV